ncbi:Replicase polyprotein 1ab protein [Quillaja saponaria]|uniref:Replicase polyprotein 1ab protein n=1 Tax=Quillaja saponaria TaxID=32244 RepID=A0AAD7VPF0_QUISA|nr:Replicase polyprotein 1ab protein [Quillaja saponaria]
MVATTLPWQPLNPIKLEALPTHHRRSISVPHVVAVRAFRRSDIDGFAKRMASGEAWRDAWRSANDGFDRLLFEAKKTAERMDRRYSVKQRLSSIASSAAYRAREIDREFEIGVRWRTFSMDFSRNWPRYRVQLNNILDTPLGRSMAGNCPACKRQFVGYKQQMIRCTSCSNIVWQPKGDFSKDDRGTSRSKSESQIIDVEFEEK